MQKLLTHSIALFILSISASAQQRFWIESFEYHAVSFSNPSLTTDSCGHLEIEGNVATYRAKDTKVVVEYLPNLYPEGTDWQHLASNYLLGIVSVKDLGKSKMTTGQISFRYVLTDGVTKYKVAQVVFYNQIFPGLLNIIDENSIFPPAVPNNKALFPTNNGITQLTLGFDNVANNKLCRLWGSVQALGSEDRSRRVPDRNIR